MFAIRTYAPLTRKLLPLLNMKKTVLVGAGVIILLGLAAEIAAPLILRHILDVDVPANDPDGVIRSSVLFAGLFIIAMICGYFGVVLMSHLGLTAVADLKNRLFAHLMALPHVLL